MQASSHSTSVGDARLPELLISKSGCNPTYVHTHKTLLVCVQGHHYICTVHTGEWDGNNRKGRFLTCISHSCSGYQVAT